MEERAVRIDELLGRSGWVRALAQELVGDAGAEDLAQEALIVGLERERKPGIPLSRWLAVVTRHLARSRWRAERRRRGREERAARPESQEGSDELLARLEVQHMVTEAVRRLEEPYRTTILLRWFEGLTPRAIAERQRISVRTVSTRLHRGLGMLRESLDRRSGDRRAWLGALVPLAREGMSTQAMATGAWLVQIKTSIIVAAAGLLAGLSWMLWQEIAMAEVSEASVVLDAGTSPREEPPISSELFEADEGRAVAESAIPDSNGDLLRLLEVPGTRASVATDLVEGLVIDVSPRPVPRVRVDARGEDGSGGEQSCAVTDEQGRFTIDRVNVHGAMRVEDPRYVTIYQAYSYGSDPDWVVPTVVVAPRIALAGQVVDPAGTPWAGARVSLLLLDMRLAWNGNLDRSEPASFEALCDEKGRFEIAAPAIEPLMLTARAEGAVVRTILLEPRSDLGLEVVLEHASAVHGVQGIVLRQDRPVPGASIRAGTFSTRSEGDGTFVLPDEVALSASEVVAALPGYQPGRSALRDPTDGRRIDPPIEVRLGSPTLAIEGRVVDPRGRPLQSVEVRALGLTWIGEREADGKPRPGAGVKLEDLSTWDGPGLFTQCDTDVDGHFTIGGLFRKTYRLGLLDRGTLCYAKSQLIEAGTLGVEVVFAPEEHLRRLEGRIVDRNDVPVPFAHLHLAREIERTTEVEAGILAREPETNEGFFQADSQGHFDIGPVSEAARVLRVSFPDDLGYSYELTEAGDLRCLKLIACHRANFRIDQEGSTSSPDSFELLDASGRRLQIVSYEGNIARGCMRWGLNGRTTGALTALEAARTIVFLTEEQEIARMPIDLVPGEIRVVRP